MILLATNIIEEFADAQMASSTVSATRCEHRRICVRSFTCKGAILSLAASPYSARLRGRRRVGRYRPPYRAGAVGAPGPAIHCREPPRRRRQYLDRGGREG